MEDTETVTGALSAIAEPLDEFWAVLDADTELDADDRADLTQLVEGAGDNIREARQLLARITELDKS